ncbi:PREDICTED: cysteine-rich receptor-like protein kinase 10 isoform X1 [Ipomoea nil]|uniref:cysteine-rich receptor-like protein kinase 10 isoform X1 n=1 Tax=Ipomoea nil TaxID=35883 RepID=UPI0009016DD6|nr:PREDICTED: cysteine-rich receptor-like protein kinase 10 isoform X1 [Ipomoea nil]
MMNWKMLHYLSFLYFALPDSLYPQLPYRLCDVPGNFAENSTLQFNINTSFLALSSNASNHNFFNTSIGNGSDTVYSMFLCYSYTTPETCNQCIESAKSDVQGDDCSYKKEAIVWEEDCQLRYSTQMFLGSLNSSGNFALNNKKNNSNPELFRSTVNQTLNNLTNLAAFNRSTMYATGTAPFVGGDTIYALVQCTLDLSHHDCQKCLEIATAEILESFYFSRGARLLSRSCYLRYELYAFYNGDKEGTNHNSKSGLSKKWTITVVAAAVTLVLAALGFTAYYLAHCYRRGNSNTELAQGSYPDDDMSLLERKFPGINNQQLPHIDIKTIIEATDNFSDLNKLGEGGFGPVFKGKLPDGKEVAVKRLLTSSEQGSEEFINEVELILKLQHKNLVTLLGFCIYEDERLLMYEYMPNGSLDAFFSDESKLAQLDWSQRLNIINGIARGMLYLHVDSRLRIIHRDLKLSNVLLDADMTPKISDFGMARIFAGNDGRSNTSMIVGTFGYMAPEFAMEGLYSIKSDVFSFGVVLLEIITAEKNSAFHLTQTAPSLVVYAWNMWNEGRGLELMDPLLKNCCCGDEFLRFMQIGLLCVQEDPFDRPNMASVGFMLEGESYALSQPKRPAFCVGRFTDHYESFYTDRTENGLTVSAVIPR